MIRTRDFALFLLCILFLGLAISSVIVRDTMSGGRTTHSSLPTGSTSVASTTFAANLPNANTIDRIAIRDRMIAKLKTDTSTITPDPSVTYDAFAKPQPTTTPAALTAATNNHIVSCLYPDDALSLVPKWPVGNVTLTLEGTTRVVSSNAQVPVVVARDASSTATTTMQMVQVALLRLPARPTLGTSPQCVPSEVIGVTLHGGLLFNNNAAAYSALGPDALIGYARDGFPIYGAYSGVEDACGGYQAATGYRYSINPSRPYIIGCFTGVPAAFNL